jgi:hypothetical protein
MTTARSEDAQDLIYGGVPITTLGEIFGLDHKEVNKRLTGRIAPVANTKGQKGLRYRVRDAAPFLCEMKMDPEEMIKNITPSKLPPALQDAFWKAQNSRQKWEENRGDLWRTARVFEVVGGAFKAIRLTILMFMDTVNQRVELSPDQRRIINELSDGLLVSLVKVLKENFADYMKHVDEHGMPLTMPEPAEAPQEEEPDPFGDIELDDDTPGVDPFA